MKEVMNIKEFISLNSHVQESFNVLNTNIRYGNNEKRMKSLCITSYSEREGKTTIALNLADSLAKVGQKVLFVDTNLRKYNDKKGFGKESIIGISNLLDANSEKNEIINKTDVDNLFIVTSGKGIFDPAKVFSSNKFDDFLKKVEGEYDYLIFDTPSLGKYIDAAIIATKCDGTLIVAKSEVTLNRQITKIKAQIEKVNGNIVGIVLNHISKREFKKYHIIKNAK